jgi:hypothetical protein
MMDLLDAHRVQLVAHCEGCGHRARLDKDGLVRPVRLDHLAVRDLAEPALPAMRRAAGELRHRMIATKAGNGRGCLPL